MKVKAKIYKGLKHYTAIINLESIDVSLLSWVAQSRIETHTFAHPQSARRAAKRIAKKLGLELEWV